MSKVDLSDIYRDYIACLNRQDWSLLGQFVDDDVCHNGRRIGLSGYREMLEGDFRDIPDLHFNIELLIADATYVASRLTFDCSSKEKFLGLVSMESASALPRTCSMNSGTARSCRSGR